jgi:hypothetical protein
MFNIIYPSNHQNGIFCYYYLIFPVLSLFFFEQLKLLLFYSVTKEKELCFGEMCFFAFAKGKKLIPMGIFAWRMYLLSNLLRPIQIKD